MKAIRTTYHGPTDTKGARIYATDMDGNRCSIPYPHELNQGQAHAAAAEALCRKLKWKGTMYGGALKDCYVFVFSGMYVPQFTL